MRKMVCALLAVLFVLEPCSTVYADYKGSGGEKILISESEIYDYFGESVLVGDSVALGFYYYARANKNSVISKMTFLTEGGFGADNALKPLSREASPIYNGQRQYIWDSIAQTGAKRVFLSYGINDLNPLSRRLVSKHEEVIKKILELSPDIEIVMVSITSVLGGAESGRINNDYIRETNTQLKELADENGWGFINIEPALEDANGNLASKYCSDGFVHLSRTTYSAVWEPYFKQYATNSLVEEGFIMVEKYNKVLITTQPCELLTVPDSKSDVLLVIPEGTDIVAKGKTSNGLYLLDLGDGNDYFVEKSKVIPKVI